MFLVDINIPARHRGGLSPVSSRIQEVSFTADTKQYFHSRRQSSLAEECGDARRISASSKIYTQCPMFKMPAFLPPPAPFRRRCRRGRSYAAHGAEAGPTFRRAARCGDGVGHHGRHRRRSQFRAMPWAERASSCQPISRAHSDAI